MYGGGGDEFSHQFRSRIPVNVGNRFQEFHPSHHGGSSVYKELSYDGKDDKEPSYDGKEDKEKRKKKTELSYDGKDCKRGRKRKVEDAHPTYFLVTLVFIEYSSHDDIHFTDGHCHLDRLFQVQKHKGTLMEYLPLFPKVHPHVLRSAVSSTKSISI